MDWFTYSDSVKSKLLITIVTIFVIVARLNDKNRQSKCNNKVRVLAFIGSS
jgi:hypothetical protein